MYENIKWAIVQIVKKLHIEKLMIAVSRKWLYLEKSLQIHNYKEKLESVYKPYVTQCLIKDKEININMDLQIIIPVYNAERYVDECLKSILEQKTKYSFQVIIIDDGSSDNTINKIKQYLTDERIVIETKENGGAASARNQGISKLTAKYLMFVDIDDILYENSIEHLLNIAYENNAQIVEGSYKLINHRNAISIKHKNEKIEYACGKLWGFSWGKVIESELFKNVIFPNSYWYEDTIMSYLIYTRSKRTITTDYEIYGYRKNPSGFSHIRGNNIKILDTYWVLKLMIDTMEQMKISKDQIIYEQILKSILTGSKRIIYLERSIRKLVLMAYSDILLNKFGMFHSENLEMKEYENSIRKKQFGKYTFLTIGIRER